MNDRLETDLWRKEMAERVLDIKIMLLGILIFLGGIGILVFRSVTPDRWEILSLILMIIGAITSIVGFFRDRDW